MFPNTPQQQPVSPASLPALPVQPGMAPQQPSMAATGVQALPATGAGMPTPIQPGAANAEEVVDRARRLVEQQAQNPYQLAETFAQLKADYLTRQHHITSNPAAN